MRAAPIATLAALLAIALPSAAAQASDITVEHVVPPQCTGGDECRYFMDFPYDNFTLTGAPGEANRITATATGDFAASLRFRDDAAAINEIAGCTRVDEHEVTCNGRFGYAHGGDGDDVVTVAGTGVYGAGDAGDDQLIGGAGPDYLNGGPGNDTLLGNGGFDLLSDGDDGAQGDADVYDGGPGGARVSYGSVNGSVTVDLADAGAVQGGPGEGDRMVAVGDVEGGMGPDDLRAAPDGSDLMGGPGDDKLTGGPGDDNLDGSYGKNVIDAGAGRDTIGPGIEVPSENQVTCGDDVDTVQTPSTKDLVGPDCDRVVYYSDLTVTSLLPLTALSRPVVRAGDFSCYERGRPNLELRVARLYRTRGLPRAGTLLGRRSATRRSCRPRKTLSVRLSATGRRLLRRHGRLPVEVRVDDPGNEARYITELAAP